MINEPKLEDRAAIPYVAIRSQVTMDEMPGLPPLWNEVYGWLGSKGIQPAGAPFWRYRIVDMENKLEIDVGVPVASAVSGEGRIIADVIPAGHYVTMVYTGPFEGDGLMKATESLLNWADKNGITWDKWPAGATGEGWSSRLENYWTDPAQESDPQKYETELTFKTAS